jgi:4-diphosphocytidyl-2-C-methyl-D-erythritol kinase
LSGIRIECRAKINLYLRIVDRREDGYHDIETVFHSIALHDTLYMERVSSGIQVECDDDRVPLNDSNTAYRAARAVLGEAVGGVKIRIEKRVPVGAGLGGGSADAAGALVGANLLFDLGLTVADLERIGRTVGADVAFLIRGGCATGLGRGDRLEPLRPLPPLPLLLVIPPLTISTSWAYGSYRMGLTTGESRLTMVKCALEKGDQAALAGLLANDFERLVFERHPSVEGLKAALIECGAEGALMTGSGPVVFGVFEKVGDAEACRGRLLSEGHRAEVSRLADCGVTVTL